MCMVPQVDEAEVVSHAIGAHLRRKRLAEIKNAVGHDGRVEQQPERQWDVGDDRRLQMAEVTRLGVAMGGQAATFAGLAGLGDLMATCMSPLSRNRMLGEQ